MNKKNILILISIILVIALLVIGYTLTNNKKTENKSSTTSTTTTTTQKVVEEEIINLEDIYKICTKCLYSKEANECKFKDGTTMTIAYTPENDTGDEFGGNYKLTFAKNGIQIYQTLEYADDIEQFNFLDEIDTKETNDLYMFKLKGSSDVDAYDLILKIYDKSMNILYDTESKKKEYNLSEHGDMSNVILNKSTFKIVYAVESLITNGEVYCNLVKESLAKNDDIVLKIDEILVGTNIKVNTRTITAKEYDSNSKYCNAINHREDI